MMLGRLRGRGAGILWCALLLASTGEAQSPNILLTVTDAGPAPPLAISVLLDHQTSANGWSFGLCHDPAGLAVVSTGLGAVGATVQGGGPPDFAQVEVFAGGWTLGVVVDFQAIFSIPAGSGLEIGEALYQGLSAGTWSVCPCDTLGTPPMATVIIYGGASLVPTQVCGTVTVNPGPYPEFIRGDANLDGGLDIADAVTILEALFGGGTPAGCAEASEANSDGTTDIADAVFIVSFLFAGGISPAPPYPDCGFDLSVDCDLAANCP